MFAILLSLLCFFQPAQPQDPQVLVAGVVYSATETSATASTLFIDDDGKLVVMTSRYGGGDDAQGQQAPTPVLTTTWIDTDGVTQTVSTPVASTTPAGQTAAVRTHEALVHAMQQIHPVRHP